MRGRGDKNPLHTTGNDGIWVHRGDRVTALLGNVRLNHVPVT
jgi:hypothetical protein